MIRRTVFWLLNIKTYTGQGQPALTIQTTAEIGKSGDHRRRKALGKRKKNKIIFRALPRSPPFFFFCGPSRSWHHKSVYAQRWGSAEPLSRCGSCRLPCFPTWRWGIYQRKRPCNVYCFQLSTASRTLGTQAVHSNQYGRDMCGTKQKELDFQYGCMHPGPAALSFPFDKMRVESWRWTRLRS